MRAQLDSVTQERDDLRLRLDEAEQLRQQPRPGTANSLPYSGASNAGSTEGLLSTVVAPSEQHVSWPKTVDSSFSELRPLLFLPSFLFSSPYVHSSLNRPHL